MAEQTPIGGSGTDGAEVRLVLTTAADAAAAERLVGQLVDDRLIACGNLVPGLLSLYRWQGAVEREGEVLVLMKTTRPRVQALFARVRELHDYDVPELLSVAVDAVDASYAQWVGEQTGEAEQ